VVSKLPLGSESFVHLTLHHDPVWAKLGGQNFIETDAQEKNALDTVGIRKLLSFKEPTIRLWLMPDAVLQQLVFHEWKEEVNASGRDARQKLNALVNQQNKYLEMMGGAAPDETLLRLAWSALVRNQIGEMKSRALAVAKAGSLGIPGSFPDAEALPPEQEITEAALNSPKAKARPVNLKPLDMDRNIVRVNSVGSMGSSFGSSKVMPWDLETPSELSKEHLATLGPNVQTPSALEPLPTMLPGGLDNELT